MRFLKNLMPTSLLPGTLARNYVDGVLENRVVVSGPFKGTKYVQKSCGSEYRPKLFGTYELELRETIRQIADSNPNKILVVGAAEGYYAIGLARLLPSVNVIAFEMQPSGRELLSSMANLNSVEDRIEILAECTPELFTTTLDCHNPDVVIMDVEGYESELLNKESADALKNSKILVELHPWVSEGIEESIAEDFQHSHSISKIMSRRRTRVDISDRGLRASLLSRWIIPLLSEMRPCVMTWLILEPRCHVC